MSQLFWGIVSALVLTVVIEVCVAWIIGCRMMHDFTAIVLVNLVTHPIFSLCFLFGASQLTQHGSVLVYLLGLEILVTLVEWQLLRRVLTDRAPAAGKLAVAINAVSGGLGFLRLV